MPYVASLLLDPPALFYERFPIVMKFGIISQESPFLLPM